MRGMLLPRTQRYLPEGDFWFFCLYHQLFSGLSTIYRLCALSRIQYESVHMSLFAHFYFSSEEKKKMETQFCVSRPSIRKSEQGMVSGIFRSKDFQHQQIPPSLYSWQKAARHFITYSRHACHFQVSWIWTTAAHTCVTQIRSMSNVTPNSLPQSGHPALQLPPPLDMPSPLLLGALAFLLFFLEFFTARSSQEWLFLTVLDSAQILPIERTLPTATSSETALLSLPHPRLPSTHSLTHYCITFPVFISTCCSLVLHYA